MALSLERYLQEYHPDLYSAAKKLSQTTGESFTETIEKYRLAARKKRMLKEKDSTLITQADLEEIVENTEGGEATIQEIATVKGSDQEKVELLRSYLTRRYSASYIESIWEAFQRSDIVPGINAGVIETQKPGSSMGYDDVITPQLKEMARLLYKKKAKNRRGIKKLEAMYREELRRCTIRAINSKNPEEALREIDNIEKKIKRCIKDL